MYERHDGVYMFHEEVETSRNEMEIARAIGTELCCGEDTGRLFAQMRHF